MQLDKSLIENLIKKLIDKYRCEIIILYGSHSENQADEYSDIDLAIISDQVTEINFYEEYDQEKFIDYLVIPKKQMMDFFKLQQAKQDQIFKQLYSGIVLYQENSLGTTLLAKIAEIIAQGPYPLTCEEKSEKILWINKMLIRTHSKDTVRIFRSYELFTGLLESYFSLRDTWYFGVRKSFNFLKKHDTLTFDLFYKILSSGLNNANLEELIERIIHSR